MSKKSMWQKLYLIAALAGVSLIVESSLHLSDEANQLLLIFWVIAAYGTIVYWLTKNPAAVRVAAPKRAKVPVAEFFDIDRIQLQQTVPQTIDSYSGNE